MTIPWNFKQYYQNLSHLKQRGHVSAGEQAKSPVSAGSRGLANIENFADKQVQMMGAKIDEGVERQYQSLDTNTIEKLREKYLPDWEYKDNSLQKRYKFEDYFQVIKFLIDTIKPQEDLDHHADLGVFYDEVLVKIYTHRTKDVTDYDFKVAIQMDMIAKNKHGAIKPDYDLNIMESGQDLYDVTSRVLLGMRSVLKETEPDIVFIHGDTTTSTAAALASFYQKIPVGHIEAGLRTHDIYSPWPEEMNRQITSKIATYHFAPTILSKQNLMLEGIKNDNIFITGNTVIDSLYWVTDKMKNDKNLLWVW